MIVDAAEQHLAAVAEIYGAAARTSVSTFDLEPAPLRYWRDKLASASVGDEGDHFLVALADSQDSPDSPILGFGYSGPFRPRPAYARTRETSIYLWPDAQGRGIGRSLYAVLLNRLRDDDIHLVVAVVAQPNPASNALHERLGFEVAGTLDEVGYKFGSYVSTRWYQLRLDASTAPAPARGS